MTLRKTVMPVAGLGTRFLPATKAQPKEMLALVDRPLIQYAVEEAVAAGTEQVILVSSPRKGAILDHFAADPTLEATLGARGKTELRDLVRSVSRLAEIGAVMQGEPLGVGHAILQAKDAVAGDSFGVMFPDDFILADVPVMEQLRRVHAEYGGLVMAVERVDPMHVDRYGVIAGQPVAAGVHEVHRLVEKPDPDEAPSNLAIVGRYVFDAGIFDAIEATAPGVGGEIQITDAMELAMKSMPCHAVEFDGQRYDCGSRLGFVKATIAVARRDPDLAGPLAKFLASSS